MNERGPVAFYLSSLGRNLVAGARLACFLPMRAHDYRASALDFALVVLSSFVLWVLAAAARIGFEGEFDPLSIPSYMSGVVLVLATALVVALVFREPGRLLLIAVALNASQPVFQVVAFALLVMGLGPPLAKMALLGFLVWIWLVALRAVAVCAGTRRREFALATAAITAMIAIDFALLPEVEPWKPADAEEAAAAPALADERLFHAQGELIARALAAVQAGRPGVPELYFIGFAPDASQDVFVREMRYVKQLFDRRFGTAGRSIALASSTDALEEFPIASVTNLARALKRVGEAMNAEEDVLFLFLSAHGDPQYRLSARQPPLELAALTPTALGRMLQDSGVKWRVIVVSACYSGGYVEPLRDANTVVITAAAPDRASFGCEAGRDFTYFGQAFFRDALAKTRSFTAAFEIAKELVAREEAAERLTPSLPQIAVGAAIAARLKHFADQPDQQ
jgi:peptidase C13-like protein